MPAIHLIYSECSFSASAIHTMVFAKVTYNVIQSLTDQDITYIIEYLPFVLVVFISMHTFFTSAFIDLQAL